MLEPFSSTPRMPPVNVRLIILGGGFAIAQIAVQDIFDITPEEFEQQEMLAFIHHLAEFEDESVAGVDARFAVSPTAVTETKILVWVCALAAIAAAWGSIAFTIQPSTRAAWLVLAMLAAALSMMFWRRLPGLSITFHISPFALTEISSDGSMRRLHWGRGLRTRDKPMLRRLELLPPDGDDYIGIPYDVERFDLLVELIARLGEFAGADDPAKDWRNVFVSQLPELLARMEKEES
jgi:hypothetical protein